MFDIYIYVYMLYYIYIYIYLLGGFLNDIFAIKGIISNYSSHPSYSSAPLM